MGVEQVTESLNAKEYKSKFRYAESCLYNYQLNLSKIKTLSEKLESLEQGSSVKAQSYEAMSFGGEVSRPVEQRAMSIINLQDQLKKLECCTRPIARMVEDLGKDYGLGDTPDKIYLLLLELRYFAKGTWTQIAQKMQISEETLKYWRQRLVRQAIEYLCI